jgi:hypothetical protein
MVSILAELVRHRRWQCGYLGSLFHAAGRDWSLTGLAFASNARKS